MRYLKLYENFNNIEIVDILPGKYVGQLETTINGEDVSFEINGEDVSFLTDDDEEIAQEMGVSLDSELIGYLIDEYKRMLIKTKMRRHGFRK
jgi:hypothetical protein